MTDGARCPRCGEPLLAYEAEVTGRYLGCPECLWMGEPERQLPSENHAELGDVLDTVADEDVPAWLMRDIEEPPQRD